MSDLVTLESLFDANASSIKVLKTVSGSVQVVDDNLWTSEIIVVPHGYTNDNLIISGKIKWTDTEFPENAELLTIDSETRYLFARSVVTWDDTNVYLEIIYEPWEAAGSGRVLQADYTIIICIV